MTTYQGNAPYCYANSLTMTLGHPVSPAVVEALTGSAFGYQRIGPMPLFDPPGWNPDLGLDQALSIMGVEHVRETFHDEEAALVRLRELAAHGPVFVGPLEMGLLLHQPGSDRPIGADHFVAVLHVDDTTVVMHDPQGHPYASLPVESFAAAWGSDTIGYAAGRFPLRTDFSAPRGSIDEWSAALLPYALQWATGVHAIPAFGPGNAEGLRALADEALDGLGEPTPSIMTKFAIRLGARRKADAADLLRGYPGVARILAAQAESIGGTQLAAARHDGAALAAALRSVADLHEDLVVALESPR